MKKNAIVALLIAMVMIFAGCAQNQPGDAEKTEVTADNNVVEDKETNPKSVLKTWTYTVSVNDFHKYATEDLEESLNKEISVERLGGENQEKSYRYTLYVTSSDVNKKPFIRIFDEAGNELHFSILDHDTGRYNVYFNTNEKMMSFKIEIRSESECEVELVGASIWQ